MGYLVSGILCLLAIVATVGMWVYQTAIKKKKGFMSKGNILYMVPTFLIIYALYFTASVYDKVQMDFFYCFTLMGKTLETFANKLDIPLVRAIAEKEIIFAIDFILVSLLASATTTLSVLSFFNTALGNWYRKNKVFHSALFPFVLLRRKGTSQTKLPF